jgi:TalC/MipB family fructose-6-phosphate aldolase
MALYVDSAFLDDITTVAQTIPIAGVTTNPTILRSARERGQKLGHLEVLNELLRRVNGSIFMQPGASDEERMYQQALTYNQVAPSRVILKIPMTSVGVRVARRLKQQLSLKYQPCQIAFTAVASVAQAYTAALVGADFVIPYYGRLMNSGINANQRLREMAAVLSSANLPARILVASIKSPQDAAQALIAGAHDLTVSPQVLLEMVSDPLSEEAVARFEQDWLTLNRL